MYGRSQKHRLIPLPLALLAAVAMAAADVVSDVLRECCWSARRRYTPGPTNLRPLAAAVSSLVKTAAEAGRVYGHVKVGRPLHMLTKFDWFCGYEPAYVVAQQRMAAVKCVLCVAAGVAAGYSGACL